MLIVICTKTAFNFFLSLSLETTMTLQRSFCSHGAWREIPRVSPFHFSPAWQEWLTKICRSREIAASVPITHLLPRAAASLTNHTPCRFIRISILKVCLISPSLIGCVTRFSFPLFLFEVSFIRLNQCRYSVELILACWCRVVGGNKAYRNLTGYLAVKKKTIIWVHSRYSSRLASLNLNLRIKMSLQHQLITFSLMCGNRFYSFIIIMALR